MSHDPLSPTRRSCRAAVAAGMLAALLLTGCASVGAPQQSRTLNAFEQLSVQPDGTRSWRAPAARRIEDVYVDPATIVFDRDVVLDDEQRQILRGEFAAALTARFADAGVRVGNLPKGSAGVTLRATITAVELASPALNIVTTALLLLPLSRGGLTLEIEALDAVSGQRVAAMAFEGRAGLQNFGSAFSSLGHAKTQMNIAAERFVALMSAPQLDARL